MHRLSRVRAVLGLMLATSMLGGSLAMASAMPHKRGGRAHNLASATHKANPPVFFAQDVSDIAPDPGARFGRLPNGMTYVIYKNKTPPGVANIYMRVAAGSMMEQDDQRGLAHFIEHMAFNGSKNVPEGEMVRLLERDGLQFGPDTNASTSNSQTVYMLNVPDATDKVVDDVMFLMRETASNLSFDPGAIDRERGVVLGEERSGGGIGTRAYEARMKKIFPGQAYSERLPIGKVEVLKTARRDAFVRFYNDFYRPEYTTLIVAGDIDPDRIEQKIRQRFADWQPGPQSPAALTRFGAYRPLAAPEAAVFTGDGLNEGISISWAEPYAERVQTREKLYQDRLYNIASGILARRFARQVKASATAFTAASFQREDIPHAARVWSLDVIPKEGKDRLAFDQAIATVRQFLAHGVTPGELAMQLDQNESFYKTSVARARTRDTSQIISTIVGAVESKEVLTSRVQNLENYEAMRPRLTLLAVNKFIRDINLSKAPTIWRQGEQETPFDRPALLAAYRTAMAAPAPALAVRSAVTWPYTSFGTPGAVVSRAPMPNVSGATRVVFANGVTLMVKPTDLEDDSVTVLAYFGNGYGGVAPDQAVTLQAANRIGLYPGGLGKLDADDIRDALTGHIYGAAFNVSRDATVVLGGTTKSDFALQMQVLMALVTDPAFRPEPLDEMKARLPAEYRSLRTSPLGMYRLKAGGSVYSDDPRFVVPTQQQLAAVSNNDIKALIRDQIGHGPIEITIVGDMTVNDAVRQVAATFGTLPTLPPAAAPDVSGIRFPTTDLHRVYTHDGRADQNFSIVTWPTTDFYADTQRAAGLELLAAVMQLRELDEVREKQGASYSVSVISEPSRDIRGFGFLQTYAMVRPENDAVFYKTVSDIVTALKATPVGEDELTRARLPLIDRLHNTIKTNDYWLSILGGSMRRPKQIEAIQGRERELNAVTPKDLQALAQTYLDMSKALRVQVKAKDGASTE